MNKDPSKMSSSPIAVQFHIFRLKHFRLKYLLTTATILAALLGLAGLSTSVYAQTKSPEQMTEQKTEQKTEQMTEQMTIEELEAYIKGQQEALEAAKAERDRSLTEAEKVRKELDLQKKKQTDLVSELESLCEERKKLDPERTEKCSGDF